MQTDHAVLYKERADAADDQAQQRDCSRNDDRNSHAADRAGSVFARTLAYDRPAEDQQHHQNNIKDQAPDADAEMRQCPPEFAAVEEIGELVQEAERTVSGTADLRLVGILDHEQALVIECILTVFEQLNDLIGGDMHRRIGAAAQECAVIAELACEKCGNAHRIDGIRDVCLRDLLVSHEIPADHLRHGAVERDTRIGELRGTHAVCDCAACQLSAHQIRVDAAEQNQPCCRAPECVPSFVTL